MPQQKSTGVRTVGRNDDNQFVGVCLCGILQNLILLGTLVSVGLIRDDDITVKRVLLIRVCGQGVDGDHAVTDIAGYGSFHIVIDNTQAVFRGILDRYTKPCAVILEEVEAFQRLLECAAYLVNF